MSCKELGLSTVPATHVFITLLLVEAAQSAASKNGRGLGGRPPHSLDLVIEALFYRLRNAGPWRDLPREFGPYQTIFGYYRHWARTGLWGRILRKVAANELDNLGDTTTLADPAVVDDLVSHRANQ